MKAMRRGILSMTVLLIAATAAAQSAPIDLAVTYDALHTNHITAQDFWMQGGAVELGARMYQGLGIAARVEGDHEGTNSTAAEPLSVVTTVCRPALHAGDAQQTLCNLRRGAGRDLERLPQPVFGGLRAGGIGERRNHV
jgi:hypothetical protein